MNISLADISILFNNQAWREEDVVVSEVSSSRELDEKLEDLSQATWQSMTEEASLKGQKLWDSEIYRLENAEESGRVLSFSTIPFSTRIGMNSHSGYVKELGLAYAPKGLYTSCVVSTTDGHYIFIEKSKAYFTKKKYAWVGGILSKTERRISSGKDLFGTVRTEVTEELGAQEEDVVANILSSGYISENWNVCLLFEIELNLRVDELQNLFKKQSDDEAVALLCIKQNSLLKEIDLFDNKDKVKFAVLGLV